MYTWRTHHAITTCLTACMHDVSTTTFATRFTYKFLGHGARQTPDYMIMTDVSTYSKLMRSDVSTCPSNMMLLQFGPV
jgi:hypothetical protein